MTDKITYTELLDLWTTPLKREEPIKFEFSTPELEVVKNRFYRLWNKLYDNFRLSTLFRQ